MIFKWIIDTFAILANYTLFPICEKMKSASANVGQSLIKKYPDKAFQAFWTYNYYSVIAKEFFVSIKRNTKLSLPIETEYIAKCFHYEIDVFNGYKLYFESGNDKLYLSVINKKGTIHIKKTPEYTLCNLSDNSDITSVVPSRTKFINVIFSNTKTKAPLTIPVDKSYFCIGNEILSASHVFMILSTTYESSAFVFDLTYELKIMDGKFNLVILKSDQWITIDDGPLGYHLKN
jgi:hypothetical protein